MDTEDHAPSILDVLAEEIRLIERAGAVIEFKAKRANKPQPYKEYMRELHNQGR